SGAPVEHGRVRQELDIALANAGKYSVAISGSVIFPHRHWERAGRPPRRVFFDWYLKHFLPRLKARDSRNRNGTYFERMIHFSGVKGAGSRKEIAIKNQLDQ